MRSIAYFFLELIFITSSLSCDLESVEDTSGCDFDSLLLVNPQTGFTVADENCGLEVDKRTFEDQPYVFYPNARDDLKYTLIMVDQDDPFTEEDKDFLQWMVINISGTSLKYGVGEFYGETLVGKCRLMIMAQKNLYKVAFLNVKGEGYLASKFHAT